MPQRKRVLCVDDDKDTCEMLAALLDAYKLDAVSAFSSEEALLRIKNERVDLYIIDGKLPGPSGLDLCREIRASDHETPIIVYSGRSEAEEREASLSAGANAYIVKPDVNSLLVAIHLLLPASDLR